LHYFSCCILIVNMTFRAGKKNKSSLTGILTMYAVIFLLWTGYRIFFRLPEWVDEFVAKPILWISPLILFQKKLLTQMVKSLKINVSYNILFGLSIGIVYFFLYILFVSYQFGLPTFNPMHFSFKGIYLQLIIALSTGFIEELIFRRYFLEEALLFFNDRIISNSFVTLLFTLIHLPIIIFVYKYSFAETISYLSLLTISGFIYGLVYLHKKSLLASTMTHAMWNFLGTIIR